MLFANVFGLNTCPSSFARVSGPSVVPLGSGLSEHIALGSLGLALVDDMIMQPQGHSCGNLCK